MPGQGGMFQRRPEGRLGALAEQQEARLQAASDGRGRPEHQLLRKGTQERTPGPRLVVSGRDTPS